MEKINYYDIAEFGHVQLDEKRSLENLVDVINSIIEALNKLEQKINDNKS